VRSFVDTNVLVYADSADAGVKQTMASAPIARCLREGAGVISTQVRHEFVNAALRNLDLHALRGFSVWGALILQPARQSGCAQVLTEDLQEGAVIGGLRIVNPFAAPVAGKARRARKR